MTLVPAQALIARYQGAPGPERNVAGVMEISGLDRVFTDCI
jgi:hypothetical protein